MGRKIQLRSDPLLGEPHKAGAKVILVQPSLHLTYGMVFVPRPQYWVLHFRWADAAFAELRALDQLILATEVDPSNSRTLDDELTSALYHVGTELIVHTVLGLRQLVLEIEMSTKVHVHPVDNLNGRFVNALAAAGFPGDLGHDPRYGQFAELQRIRDAIEHPQEDNVYNSIETHWDEVPLAWITSGKALRAYEAARSLLDEVITFWVEVRKKYARPGTLQVERGIKSAHPVKKAPRQKA